MGKFRLFAALATPLTICEDNNGYDGPAHIVILSVPNGPPVRGYVLGIRRETGSGHDWIVTLRTVSGATRDIYVKTD